MKARLTSNDSGYGWWVRRTGERDPVLYVADIDRLRRDASELLTACKRTIAYLSHDTSEKFGERAAVMGDLRAAIAKAEGGAS